ncbi:hypothetical protein EI94DRAFT_1802042 [Lactarius quietus]|nr:hypothetical protein EI94DRAFT_1802042 [Lactarius quietus]
MSSMHTHVLAHQLSPTPPLLQAPIVATIQVNIDKSLLKQGKKRISRRQSSLITVGSGNSSSGTTTSSTAKSQEDAAIHRHWQVDADEDTELGRASNRGKKKRTLVQAQAEEVPVEEGTHRS